MTTPKLENSTSSDAPIATVGVGPSEIAGGLVILAGLLDSYFGKDWGLGKNAQALGLLVTAVVTFGLTIARAIKHHAAMHANAAVYVAQLNAATIAATTGGVTAKVLAVGVSALNQPVVPDPAEPSDA